MPGHTRHPSRLHESFWAAIEQGGTTSSTLNHYHYVRAHRVWIRGHRENEEFGQPWCIAVHPGASRRALPGPFERPAGPQDPVSAAAAAFISYILPTEMLRDAGLQEGDYIEQFAQNLMKAVIACTCRRCAALVTSVSCCRWPGSPRRRELQVAQSIDRYRISWAVNEPNRCDPEAHRVQHRCALLNCHSERRQRDPQRQLQMTDQPGRGWRVRRGRTIVARAR